jgi:hypothetical protein
MVFQTDHRPDEANARPIFEVADMLAIEIGRGSVERIGPCPKCGGPDRFGLNGRKNVFLCRRGGGKGGPIDLVMFVMGLTFPAALEWMCGPRADISEAEIAARRAKAAKARADQEREANAYRQRSIAAAREIWANTLPAEDTAVRDYLARRGFSKDVLGRIPKRIRFSPDARYMIQNGKVWREIHRGPAMVAAVDGPSDTVLAVHRTWIDLEQSKGKVMLKVSGQTDGKLWPAKKVLGSKKGGVVILRQPEEAEVLVMAEGLETTLSALVANVYPNAAYWCGVDLGNMSGKMQSGQGLKFAGLPDLADTTAFVPPEWVRRLIFVMDGDSEPRLTQAKLEAGLRRAMIARPGLVGEIVRVGAGLDLNDVLMGVPDAE